VAASYHGVEIVRARPAAQSRVFRASAGVYFDPDDGCYEGTRLRPVVVARYRRRNPLRRIADVCQRRGLEVRAWTVCCHNSVLAERHPDMAIKDAFGTPDPTWLCPINPDVREYICGLVADLSRNYPLAAIELESPTFPPTTHRHTHRKVGAVLGEAGEFLSRLCFCESCRQRAVEDGVDAAMAGRSVRVWLEQLLEHGAWPMRRSGRAAAEEVASEGPTIEDLLGEDEALRTYVEWRQRRVVETIRRAASVSRVPLLVYAMGEDIQAGVSWARVGKATAGLLVQCFGADAERVEDAVARFAGAAGGVDRLAIGLWAGPPVIRDSACLVRLASRAAELGVRCFHYYLYGILPEPSLTWVRQAIRAARRIAEQEVG